MRSISIKTSLFIISIFIFTAAQASSLQLRPKNPYEVCSDISNTYWSQKCVKEVSDAQSIDEFAAAACDNISNSSYAYKCMTFITNSFYDRGVPRVCASITNSYYQAECMKAAANKRYDRGNLMACKNITNSSRAYKCMSNSGRAYDRRDDDRRRPGRSCLSERTVIRKARMAKRMIREGQDYRSIRLLDELIDQAESCARRTGPHPHPNP